MTLSDYLRVFRERWITIAVMILLGVGGSAALFYASPPEYTATSQLYVSAGNADNAQSAFIGAQLSAQRVTSYTELVKSPRVATEVIVDLALDMPTRDLSERLQATNQPDSILITVSFVDSSPELASSVVNAATRSLTRLVDELEAPQSPLLQQSVSLRVVEQASVPTQPSSPGVSRLLGLGLLVGLVAGVVGAIIRDAVDSRVKSLEQLEEIVDAPGIGQLGHDPKFAKSTVLVQSDTNSETSEALRQIRTNVSFIDVGNRNKVLIVSSAVPSEGKTTLLTNLAILTASAGARVLIVDADLRRPRVAEALGLESTVGLTTILSGRMSVQQSVQMWGGSLLDVIASGPVPPNPSELLASQYMAKLLSDLRVNYDLILLDTPPLLPVTDAAALAPLTDGVLFACKARSTSRAQVRAAATSVRSAGSSILGAVLTMADQSPNAIGYRPYYPTDVVRP